MAFPVNPFFSKARGGYTSTVEMLKQIAIDITAYSQQMETRVMRDVKALEWDFNGNQFYQILFECFEVNSYDDPENPGTTIKEEVNKWYITMLAESPPQVGIQGGGGTIKVYTTTPTQLYIDTTYTGGDDKGFVDIGLDEGFADATDGLSGSWQTKDTPWMDWYFGDPSEASRVTPSTTPCGYRVTWCERGFFFMIWREGSDHNGSKFSWGVCQRAVDKQGRVMNIGKNPVFTAFCSKGDISKFVIRENDVPRPSPIRSATENSEDSLKIMNDKEMVATTEYGKYVVFFPSNVNTPRYTYREELDLIGYTSADVISQDLNVDLEVFGGRKKYKAMHANGPHNTKMRLMVLVGEQFPNGVDADGKTIWDSNAPGPNTQKEDGEKFFNPDLELFPEPEIDDNIFSSSNPGGGT